MIDWKIGHQRVATQLYFRFDAINLAITLKYQEREKENRIIFIEYSWEVRERKIKIVIRMSFLLVISRVIVI